MTDSHFLHKEPCPGCGSRDNLARYSDGHAYCFGCGHYEHGDGEPKETRTVSKRSDLVEVEVRAITSRGLDEETCKRWGYGVHSDDGGLGTIRQVATYRDASGVPVMQKWRTREKQFGCLGDKWWGLYGMHLWRDGGRRVIITEGEIDAMSVSQVLGHKWPVVSLPHGAASAAKAVQHNLEWLLKFEEVALCFDMDDPGREAVEACAPLFPPGKCSVISLPLKDANEMLVSGRVEELVQCLWNAKKYRPDGLVTAADVAHLVMQEPRSDLTWCLPALNAATYGRRYGEAVALGAGTGVGKTTYLTQQIAHDLQDGHAVAVFAFEQQPAETVKRVAGQMIGKTFHIPDSGWTQEDLRQVIASPAMDRLFLYDHFGACDWDVVRERIRYLAHAHGVRIFYLDHLTALASMQDDERKALEIIMAEIGGLVKELDIWLLFVSHLATPDGTPHEEGGRVTIRHFKGSRAIGYWSHFMFGLERDQQSDDAEERNRTIFRVLKDRYTGGATGLTIPLTYDRSTGLMAQAPTEIRNEATAEEMGF